MINNRLVFSIILLASLSLNAREEALGEEHIRPLRFPKFSLSSDYALGKRFHGFDDQEFRYALPNQLAAALSFEAGLYKYFNAGAIISFNIPLKIMQSEPMLFRLSLFAKPYIALGERFGFFGRIGGGLSGIPYPMAPMAFVLGQAPGSSSDFQSVYQEASLMGGGYTAAFGGNAFASLGLEVFPWTRFGIALEGGIRADFMQSRKGSAKLKGPNSFNYMFYEYPLGLMLHIIL